jgi:hypothetical protein
LYYKSDPLSWAPNELVLEASVPPSAGRPVLCSPQYLESKFPTMCNSTTTKLSYHLMMIPDRLLVWDVGDRHGGQSIV